MIPLHAKKLIQEIRSTGKKISKIEEGFISSVFVQASANRLLTEKQAKWLQDIYDKCSGGGQHQDREFIR